MQCKKLCFYILYQLSSLVAEYRLAKQGDVQKIKRMAKILSYHGLNIYKHVFFIHALSLDQTLICFKVLITCNRLRLNRPTYPLPCRW